MADRVNKRELTNKVDNNEIENPFVVFSAIPSELSENGRWYIISRMLINGYRVFLQVHLYRTTTISLNEMVGFDNTGNIRVWPSEECLAYFISENCGHCVGRTFLELGAGMTGLAGLMAAALRAREVVLSDGNDKCVMNLKIIAAKNSYNSRNIRCMKLRWDETLPGQQFDTVLCTDCLFYKEDQQNLLDCTYRHLASGGMAYFMAPNRNGCVDEFVYKIRTQGERWSHVNIIKRFGETLIKPSAERFDTSITPDNIPSLIVFQKSKCD